MTSTNGDGVLNAIRLAAPTQQFSTGGFAAALKPNVFDGANYKCWRAKMMLWLTAMNVIHVAQGKTEEALSPEEDKAFEAADNLFREKSRIEAQVMAAEAAVQLRLEEETRMKREQERKAARMTIHMMNKTVDIDNSDFLKDLENFCQKWQSNPPCKLVVDFVNGIEFPSALGSPLEALGLFMKQDLEEELEHEMDHSITSSPNDVVEEGEISCYQ